MTDYDSFFANEIGTIESNFSDFAFDGFSRTKYQAAVLKALGNSKASLITVLEYILQRGTRDPNKKGLTAAGKAKIAPLITAIKSIPMKLGTVTLLWPGVTCWVRTRMPAELHDWDISQGNGVPVVYRWLGACCILPTGPDTADIRTAWMKWAEAANTTIKGNWEQSQKIFALQLADASTADDRKYAESKVGGTGVDLVIRGATYGKSTPVTAFNK